MQQRSDLRPNIAVQLTPLARPVTWARFTRKLRLPVGPDRRSAFLPRRADRPRRVGDPRGGSRSLLAARATQRPVPSSRLPAAQLTALRWAAMHM